MPRIDIECAAGHQSEVYRALADWPVTPACPVCAAPTAQFHPQPRTRWTPDPIIVYEAPDGTPRIPGDAQGQSAANYERLGYRRIELRGAAETRAYERKEGSRLDSISRRRFEVMQAHRETREREQRSNLRQAMTGLDARGRDFARAVMARNDGRPMKRPGEAGFVSEVYSYDRSNRETSRDPQGRKRRD